MNNTNDTEITVDNVLSFFQNNNFVVIGLYVPVFIIALLANVLVIWVVIRDQYMRSVTNYFLVNLSVADLFVTLVCMPNAAYAAYTAIYSFGEYTCKIQTYFQCVSVASSIFTITAMSVDRYLAITRPLGLFYRCFNRRTTVIVIFVLWLLSFLLFLPVLLVSGGKVEHIPLLNNQNVSIRFCVENWEMYFGDSAAEMRQGLGITWFIFMFVVPGVVMLFAYAMMSRTLCAGVPPFDNDGPCCMQQRNRLMRGRRRVACILLLLAFVFAACWLPYHVINLLEDINSKNRQSLKANLLLLGHANSALNPIIYCALSRRFRRSIRDLICIDIQFPRRRQNMQWADSSGSGTQFHYLHRIKSVPTVQNQLQSSQKTTKTCAV